MLTGAATVGAIALGQRPASAAVKCGPKCGPSPFCTSPPCPNVGCPSGKKLCKNNCNGLCDHATGSWVYCSGYGRCGNGYTICQDCHKQGSCYVCICLSGIICADCCSSAEVVAEHQRIQELTGAVP